MATLPAFPPALDSAAFARELAGLLPTGPLWNGLILGCCDSAVPPAPTPPAQVTGVTLVACDGHVNVSWTAVEGATSYGVFTATSPGAEGSTPAVITTATSAVLTAADGITLYVTVAAANAAGYGAPSAEQSATPTVLAAPAGLTLTAGDGSITASWSVGANAVSTTVTLLNGATLVQQQTVTGTTATFSGLTDGTTYTVTAVANNVCGQASTAASATATPVAPVHTLLYFNTTSGGANNNGTVNVLDVTSGVLTVLHSNASGDGYSDQCTLTIGPSGNLWGSRVSAVYKLAKSGSPFSVVATTNQIYSGLILGNDGNMWGVSYSGGSNNNGALWKITPAGVTTAVYSWTSSGLSDGKSPYGMILGSDGNFYGCCEFGGASSKGTLWKLTPAGSFTRLHTFTGSTSDGAAPFASCILASDGYLYGATTSGGANSAGCIYKCSTDGSTFVLLYSFQASGSNDLGNCWGRLLEHTDGYLYGVAESGGAHTYGGVFRIKKDGSSYTVLNSFAGTPDGRQPTYSSLAAGADGYLYGVSYEGGASNKGGVFRINTATAAVSIVYSLANSGAEGIYPYGGILASTS